jgi:hypothetical protein
MDSGVVVIGATAPPSGTNAGDLAVIRTSSPTTGVVFFGNSGNYYIYWNGSNWSVPNGSIVFGGGGATVTAGAFNVPGYTGQSGQFQVKDSAGSNTYLLSFSGGILATYSLVSDMRIKKNIRPFTRGLEAILGLRPKTFEYIEEIPGTHYNVVAQDIQEFLPEAVTEQDTVFEGVKQKMLNVAERPIVMALINAVQELTRRLVALEAHV